MNLGSSFQGSRPSQPYLQPTEYAAAPIAAQPPLMVNKTTAAAMCSMGPATYDKYAKRKLLPPMNATGRVSVAALQQAALRLDGVQGPTSYNDADEALAKWERDA